MSLNAGDKVNQASIECSVKRLGTYIDFLHIHRLDRQSPVYEIVRALDDARTRGLIHYVAGSSVKNTIVFDG